MFAYDNLNRITSALVTDLTAGTSLPAQNVTYDSLGNITFKTGVGTYGYGAGGPHAVTSTTVGGLTYAYDANGNMTSDSSGRTLVYTTFDKPSQITKGGHTTTFKYGAGRARYMRTDDSGSGLTTTRYIGNVEKITRPDGSVDVKRRLGNVMITLTTPQGGGTATRTEYLLTDHLGSIEVILDNGTNGANGPQVMEKMDFDAWGARRHDDSWALMSNAEILGAYSISSALNTYRGFTGHEMLDAVGLIHMNGRVYDPRLGRFLQADPFIQAGHFTQSYNRYSYGFNNPLNGTDPSGYIFGIDDVLIGAAIGLAFGAAGDALDLPVLSAVGGIISCGTSGIGCAAGFGFGTTLGAGGSFGDALKNGLIAGVSAYAFSEIGGAFTESSGFLAEGGLGHIGAHATTGGIMNVLAGGKFGHGFASAGIAKAANVNGIFGTAPELRTARIVSAAVIGGTASAMTGGKFANGAITAAFGQAYNGEQQASRIEAAKRMATQQLARVEATLSDLYDNLTVKVGPGVGWKLGVHYPGMEAYLGVDAKLQSVLTSDQTKQGIELSGSVVAKLAKQGLFDIGGGITPSMTFQPDRYRISNTSSYDTPNFQFGADSFNYSPDSLRFQFTVPGASVLVDYNLGM